MKQLVENIKHIRYVQEITMTGNILVIFNCRDDVNVELISFPEQTSRAPFMPLVPCISSVLVTLLKFTPTL